MVKSRKSAGLIAFAVLAWSALRFFQALVRGVNRAWGTKEYSWWRLPIKNLFMTAILASALLLGVVAPIVLKQIEEFYWKHSREIGLDFGFVWYLFEFAKFDHPAARPVLRHEHVLQIRPAAADALSRSLERRRFSSPISLEVLQRLFVLYTTNIGQFNALYGTFGSVVALLLWIYLSRLDHHSRRLPFRGEIRDRDEPHRPGGIQPRARLTVAAEPSPAATAARPKLDPRRTLRAPRLRRARGADASRSRWRRSSFR